MPVAGGPHRLAWPAGVASAVVTVVALLHDEAVAVKAQQRNPGEILGAAIVQLGLRAPRHGRLIAVHDRGTELGLGRLLLREYAGEVAGLRIAERMLLPERALGIQRGDRGLILFPPAAFPYRCPLLSCFSCVHASRVG